MVHDHPQNLSDRQLRELLFYEEYSQERSPGEINFDPVFSARTRPWNPNWFVYERVKDRLRSGSRRLLEIGCGGGESSVCFARMGYEVHGIDLAPGQIAIAQGLARQYQLESRTTFSAQVAEDLEYPDAAFDIVVGIDVLHHMEVRQAVGECLRVLRPGGIAIFKEWRESPLLDRVRMWPPVLHFFPKRMSLELHITADERKLSPEDLSTIRELCPNLSISPFRLLARLHRLFPARAGKASILEKLDQTLFRLWPGLGTYSGTVVLILRK